METLTIKVKNRERLLFLYRLLKYFDFVELPEMKDETGASSKGDFFTIAGIWKDREVSQESIRKKAWRM